MPQAILKNYFQTAFKPFANEKFAKTSQLKYRNDSDKLLCF